MKRRGLREWTGGRELVDGMLIVVVSVVYLQNMRWATHKHGLGGRGDKEYDGSEERLNLVV